MESAEAAMKLMARLRSYSVDESCHSHIVDTMKYVPASAYSLERSICYGAHRTFYSSEPAPHPDSGIFCMTHPRDCLLGQKLVDAFVFRHYLCAVSVQSLHLDIFRPRSPSVECRMSPITK